MTSGIDAWAVVPARRKIYALAAVVGVLILVVVGYQMTRGRLDAGSPAPADFAVMLAPPGVTLTMIGQPVVTDGVSHLRPYQKGDVLSNGITVFSDADGKTYYTYDKDTELGKPSCAGDCLKAWSPAAAPADASPGGDWTLITYDDGSRQWAFRNKPLYTSAKDRMAGDANGNGADGGVWHMLVFASGSVKEGHYQEPAYKPAIAETVPFGIAVHEVDDAGGWVLTDDAGRTLYTFGGDPKEWSSCDSKAPCDNQWLPLGAPELAEGAAEFTIVKPPDGTRQWAYKGWPLYRYAGDTTPGQCNGMGIDARWKPAVLVRYPVPAPVMVQSTSTVGKIFVTAAGGHSIYRQFLYYYSAEAGDFAHGYPYSEIVGRLVGTNGCTGECTSMWHPLTAAPQARSAGHWTILTRPDGTRQWAYKGYALYTFEGDKKPHDLHGLDIWDITPSDPDIHAVSLLTRLKIDAETVTGMVFTTAYP